MAIIKGKVFVITKRLWTEQDLFDFGDHTILIVKNTTPDITIVINKVEVIVTEVENLLCHAAIICREYNKPLLMGIKNATKKFKTGDEVIINLENKTIINVGLA
ncbi:MAG: hypothetical protein Athens101410_571 [Parcubacteria group bacterium Athens1014_10]|nr:MAG: hypothetical protein Athens101410_571 [Parcubacteria group bacterium Athens1014_10]TSD04713.1 MAG: hypothetical protein Athens071412_657 [Parcubacteria group bacterium Athens0714_12]